MVLEEVPAEPPADGEYLEMEFAGAKGESGQKQRGDGKTFNDMAREAAAKLANPLKLLKLDANLDAYAGTQTVTKTTSPDGTVTETRKGAGVGVRITTVKK